jgi:hypothetical protein
MRRDGISIAIPDKPRRCTPLTWEHTGGDRLQPEKYKRMAKEGVLHATRINNIRFFPQAPRFTNCVRAVWPVSGENAKDHKQEN